MSEQTPTGAAREHPTSDDLALFYDVTWQKATTFFEWRHKLMTFTFAAVGAGIVAAGWLLDKNASQFLVGGLLLFLAGLVVTTRQMDQRVSVHMADAYKSGDRLEKVLTGGQAEDLRAHLPLGALLRHRQVVADDEQVQGSRIARSGESKATESDNGPGQPVRQEQKNSRHRGGELGAEPARLPARRLLMILRAGDGSLTEV